MKILSPKKYLILLSCVVQLGATEMYTIDELILESIKNSPDLQISKLQYEASKSRYDAAFSNYLPKLDALASAGKIHQDKTNNSPVVDDTLLLGKLTLKQIIYDFGKTGGSTDTQKFNSQAYKMENMQKTSDKKRDVKQAYYTVLKANALIDVQKENVKLNKAQLYRSKKYFEAGIRTKIDVSDAEVQVIKAKLELKKAEYNLKLAYTELDRVVGFETLEQEYDVYTQELDLSNLYDSLHDYKLSLTNAITYAYEHRFEMKKELANIKAKESDTRTVNSEYYPSIFLDAAYKYQDANEYNKYVPQTQWNAGINLSWNLYQGGSTSARKQEKSINASISSAKLHDTKLLIKKNTTNAYIQLNRSKDTVELDQSLLKVSNEKFDQASKRYEHGLSDYIELQESRQGYIDAKAKLVIDYYNYYIAIADLDNAIGE